MLFKQPECPRKHAQIEMATCIKLNFKTFTFSLQSEESTGCPK